jgi:hypothetical protein
MRCTVIFRERVATFFLKKMSFLPELQPGILFFVVPSDFLKYSRRFSKNHPPNKIKRIFGFQNTGSYPDL